MISEDMTILWLVRAITIILCVAGAFGGAVLGVRWALTYFTEQFDAGVQAVQRDVTKMLDTLTGLQAEMGRNEAQKAIWMEKIAQNVVRLDGVPIAVAAIQDYTANSSKVAAELSSTSASLRTSADVLLAALPKPKRKRA